MKYEYPKTMRVTTGTGLQRPLECKDCNISANEARLLMPIALAYGPDGSIYIGDFNLIRKLPPDGNMFTVLELRYLQMEFPAYLHKNSDSYPLLFFLAARLKFHISIIFVYRQPTVIFTFLIRRNARFGAY